MRLLWQGEPAPEESISPFDRRVVDEVTFDTNEKRAKVKFVETPIADSVTVTSNGPENTDDIVNTAISTDTREMPDHLQVSLDPEGDEVIVRATVADETVVVHRERYPPSERLINDITYETDSEDNLFDGTARIEFNEMEIEGTVTAKSTRAGGESSLKPVRSGTFLTVDIDPEGDEVIVTLTK